MAYLRTVQNIVRSEVQPRIAISVISINRYIRSINSMRIVRRCFVVGYWIVWRRSYIGDGRNVNSRRSYVGMRFDHCF